MLVMSKLEEARDILTSVGRTKGELCDDNGCMCPLGALASAHGMTTDQLTSEDFVERELAYAGISDDHKADILWLAKATALWHPKAVEPESDHYNAGFVWRYNDRQTRADEQIIALFNKAIELRDEQADAT